MCSSDLHAKGHGVFPTHLLRHLFAQILAKTDKNHHRQDKRQKKAENRRHGFFDILFEFRPGFIQPLCEGGVVHSAGENFFTDVVRFLYSTDTPTNVCPSIHAFNSIAAHIAICKNKKLGTNRWIRYGSLVLMISITLSTMFLKQHSAFDVICALILSGIMYKLVYATDYTVLFRRFHKKEKQYEG